MAFKRTPLKRSTGISPSGSKKAAAKKQAMISTYKEIDSTRDQICGGCGCGRNLSHSHIISRKDTELSADPDNIALHCLPIIGSNGCSWKWEQVGLRCEMMDYQRNMEYIKRVRPDVFRSIIVKDYSYLQKHREMICRTDFFDYICDEFKKIQ